LTEAALRKRPTPATARATVASHREADTQELYGIGDLCAEFGITARAVRFYEDKGLLKPRRVNGSRIYTKRDRTRLALILRSKAIGASLTEIKHFLELYGAHGEGRVQQMKYVLARTDEAIAQLETKRAHIDTTLEELRVINDAVRRALLTSYPRSATSAAHSKGRRPRAGGAGVAAAARLTEDSS
jgi:DNA-binding transcriptional MerR regulator